MKAINAIPREHAPRQNQKTETAAGNAGYAIETFGERFTDGSAIELIVDENEAEIAAQRLEHDGRIFIPPAAAGDVVKAVQFPTHVGSYGSTSQRRSESAIRSAPESQSNLGVKAIRKRGK